MRLYTVLILIIGIVAQKDEKDNLKKNENDIDGTEADYGNPDIYNLTERPCPVYDRFCIRGYFARHSNCKIVPGPIEEPFYVTESQIYLSDINATATSNDSRFRGLNGQIQSFYINKATGNLVLSVFFEGVMIENEYTYFRFFRNGQSPITLNDRSFINYKKMTVTVVIPNYEDLKLDRAEISGYLDDGFPPFTIGPAVVGNPDPTVQASILGLLADIPSAAKANMLTVASLVGKIFIQKNICDFGVPVNKIVYDANALL